MTYGNEGELVKELKMKMKDCVLPDSSDDYLLKWLAARNYHLGDTEKALREALEWRRSNRVDEILKEYEEQEIFQKYFALDMVGKDKYGCPVWFSALGVTDLKGIVHSVPMKECIRYLIWKLEKMAQEIQLANSAASKGSKVEGQVFLLDMNGLKKKQIISKPVVNMMLEAFKLMETYYPGLHRRIFVINASKVFSALFSMIKGQMNKGTINKLHILGHEKDEWMPALLKEIDADQLPLCYGGTSSSSHWTRMLQNGDGGEVPKSYYMRNNKPMAKDGMESLNLPGGAKKKIKYNVNAANSTLRWEFLSEGGGIAFRIYCKTCSGENIEILPFSRVESHLFMEEGEMICELIGSYVFEFDNRSKLFKQKKVIYEISVEPPVLAVDQ